LRLHGLAGGVTVRIGQKQRRQRRMRLNTAQHRRQFKMRTLEILMASLMLHGCVIAGSDSALVAGLSGPMTDHAAALAVDGGPLSQRTGRVLIAKFDAGAL
tara:strand:+ start:369 stop:671 length:303 start_codon:yes stop_codon:yes gene_type:complete